jgi:hypothetical protein
MKKYFRSSFIEILEDTDIRYLSGSPNVSTGRAEKYNTKLRIFSL